jgi:hypothetical protein
MIRDHFNKDVNFWIDEPRIFLKTSHLKKDHADSTRVTHGGKLLLVDPPMFS